jgi:hypothetical protein
MKKRLVTVVFTMLSIPALGGVAYAASQSVSDSPRPQVIIPASAAHSPGDNPATHDGRDDHGIDTATSTTVSPPGAPAKHDVRDDNGVDAVTGTSVATDDNPATHDVGDDNGVDAVTGTSVPSNDNPATHDVGDDNGVDALTSSVPATGIVTTTGTDERHKGTGTDDGSGHS